MLEVIEGSFRDISVPLNASVQSDNSSDDFCAPYSDTRSKTWVPNFLISHRLYQRLLRASGVQYTDMEYTIRCDMRCIKYARAQVSSPVRAVMQGRGECSPMEAWYSQCLASNWGSRA